MSTDAQDDDDVGPELTLRVACDYIILEAAEKDPERVMRALAGVVDRCKTERRYSAEEIDAAAEQLLRQLGITRRAN